MWKIPAAVITSVSAAVIAAGFAPAAFAAPAGHFVQAPLQNPSPAPDPHASMTGMDHDMPGMTHDEMPGVDHDMPGMTHDEAPGMDHDMPGMTHDEAPGMDHHMPGMTHDEAPGMDPDMPGMTHGGHGATGVEPPRPQGAVVGSFVVFNGGVLLTAGLMRRRAKTAASARTSRASGPTK